MHHYVGSYAEQMAFGECYIYSIIRGTDCHDGADPGGWWHSAGADLRTAQSSGIGGGQEGGQQIHRGCWLISFRTRPVSLARQRFRHLLVSQILESIHQRQQSAGLKCRHSDIFRDIVGRVPTPRASSTRSTARPVSVGVRRSLLMRSPLRWPGSALGGKLLDAGG